MVQLLSNLPVGAKVKDTTTKYNGQPIIFKVAAKNHTGYPTNSVTLITDGVISVKPFDAKEPSNPNADRQGYGNNRYLHSNIRQWLNKEGSSWYVPQHAYDQPPSTANVSQGYPPYDTEVGFLSGFSSSFKNKILDTNLTVLKNTITDGGGSETVTDKVFLLSVTEVAMPEIVASEGYILPLFHNLASREAYLISNPTRNQTWFLRTPYTPYSARLRAAGSDDFYNTYASYSDGVRPALNLSSDVSVSDTTDADGAYVIQWNSAPTISGTDENLGNITAPFSRNFTVNDADGTDTLVVTIKVNGSTIQTINNAVRNQTYTANLTSSWSNVPLNSTSTMTVAVSDGKAITTRTYTFVKKDDRINVKMKNLIETSIAAKRIVASVRATVPTGATMKFYATNNAFDTSPVWEDITSKVNTGTAHNFTNTSKVAAKWGISVRIEILKGTASTLCYLNGFGCSFE